MRFYQKPTEEQISQALEAVPTLEGLDYKDWAKAVLVIAAGREKQADGSYLDAWSLYFDVATRVLMARKWHEAKGEGEQYKVVSVEIQVEGSPDESRFYVVKVVLESPLLGPATGIATADLSEAGGRADKTNPIENAITSAMGRAIGLDWGIGLLPGSGAVATADEVAVALDRKGKAVEPSKRGGRKKKEEERSKPEPEPDEPPEGTAEPEAEEIAEELRQSNIQTLAAGADKRWGDESEDKLSHWFCREYQSDEAPPLAKWGQEAVVHCMNDLKKKQPDLFERAGEGEKPESEEPEEVGAADGESG